MTHPVWRIIVFFILIAFIVMAPIHRSENKISKALNLRLSGMAPEEKELVWIYFKDKGPEISLNKRAAAASISDKALKRRAKVRRSDNLINEMDYPLSGAYLKALSENGIAVRHTSKWFNAVSAWVSREQMKTLTDMEFVLRLDPVGRFSRNPRYDESAQPEINEALHKINPAGFDSAFYGFTYTQLQQIKVPNVHQLGYYGQGVTVAVFDNGFRLLSHEALGMNIVGTYDFVDKKTSVVPLNPSPSFGTHGINTLSVIGGFKEGKLVGPAYKSDYLLARTENDSSETPFEEDNWIAAMEWAEGLGADIVSSSLGYIDMTGIRSYDWTWMSGDSTVITKGANIGVGMGLVIVNSAGNEGFNALHNTLGAPADGDSVIAVGAVDASGVRVGFSSVGPTTRGRIKPDVMAMGYAVTVASSTLPTGYSLANGTSFACPLTAGVCALILSAHPGLSPAQVRWALKMTANNSGSPDNLYGYGLINALAAVNYFGITAPPDTTDIPDRFVLYQNAGNPFNDFTTINYDVKEAGNVRIAVYNMLGQKVRTLVDRHHSVQSGCSVTWNGTNMQGKKVSSGIYFYRLEAKGFVKTKKMLLVR